MLRIYPAVLPPVEMSLQIVIVPVRVGELLPEASTEKKGLMPAKFRRRITYVQIPSINTEALHIATYKKSSSYCGHVIRILIGSFKTSCDLIMCCDHAVDNYNFRLKGYGFTPDQFGNIILVETDLEYKIYITGTYNSTYNGSNALIESTSDLFIPVDNGEIVQVSSLAPVKTISIADSLIGG